MSNKAKLKALKKYGDETYGQYCDRLEDAIMDIIKHADVSAGAVKILAFALMRAPADFDAGSRERPFEKARVFLSSSPLEVKAFFREECKKLPCGRDDRVSYLLGE